MFRRLLSSILFALAAATGRADVIVTPAPPPAKVILPPGKGLEQTFLRGDANSDEKVDISDAVSVLSCLFTGGACTSCRDAADANDDGIFNMSDGVYLLNFLFREGPDPGAPFPACDLDPTGDGLGCDSYPCAREYPIGTQWTRMDLPGDSLEGGRVFEYVQKRGGRLVWRDGYDVGGKLYFALIFEKTAPTLFAHYSDLSGEVLDARLSDYWARGWSVRQLDSYSVVDGSEVETRYSVIFEAVPRPKQRVFRGVGGSQLGAKIHELRGQGYRPVNLSAAATVAGSGRDPRPNYTGLWSLEGADDWILRTDLTSSALGAEINNERLNGRELTFVHAHSNDGEGRFVAIFEPQQTTDWRASYDQTLGQHGTTENLLAADGFKLRLVTGYSTASTPKLAALWTED